VSSGFKSIAVMTDDKSTMSSSVEEDSENIGILNADSSLEPYKDHFKYRLKRYLHQKKLIEEYEGSLEEFAKGDYNC
jgi:1,4-alpha-glucan branching enzyme